MNFSEDRKHQIKYVTFFINLVPFKPRELESIPSFKGVKICTETFKKDAEEEGIKEKEKKDNESFFTENYKEIKLKTQPWTKIIQLKSRISEEYSIPNQYIRLFYRNIEMISNLTVLDYQLLDKTDNNIFYKIEKKNVDLKSGHIQVYGCFPLDKKILKLMEEIRFGFMKGFHPVPNNYGTGGTYFLKSGIDKEYVAVFKPIDEEACAPNNTKGYPGKFGQQSFRKGILSGEGSIREVAASILDINNKKMFKVPETSFVEILHKSFANNSLNSMVSAVNIESISKIRNSIIHNFILENVISSNTGKITNVDNFKEIKSVSIKTENSEENLESCMNTNLLKKDENEVNVSRKYGSLQKFVHNTEVAVNFCSDLFSVEEVHKIGILDIRILNCDRNDENVLVIK